MKDNYFLQNFNYSRLQIISNLLKNIDIYPLKIAPPFRKKIFLKNIAKRNLIINDFFVSDYDSAVYDRKLVKKYSIKSYYYYIIDYINFKFSKFLLADTYTHFRYWENLFGNTKAQIFILPVLANVEIYKPLKIKNKEFTILFYGTFIPLHGIDKIVKAFKILESNKLNIKYKIIGNGQMLEEIKKLVKELNLSKLILIDKNISEKELVVEINKANIILGIFGDSRKAKSVVPNKVYQSLACKKCIITMDSPAIREFFDDNDLYLVENNENAIAESIINLYENKLLIQEYEINGYNKFINLYERTKKDFIEFIYKAKGEL